MNNDLEYVRAMNKIINRRVKREMDEQKKAAHVQAAMKYNKTNVKQIKLNLNRKTDADIIEQLEACGNVQGYIKDLIRKDMKK